MRFSSKRDRKKKWIKESLILTGVIVASTPQAKAYDAGFMLGGAWVNHDVGSHLSWGLTAHTDVLPILNVGVYYQHFSNDYTTSTTTTSFNYNWLAAEANLKPFAGIPPLDGAYIGVKFGLALSSSSIPNTSTSVNVLFGPTIGYDYPIGLGFTLGGQANILWTTGSVNGEDLSNFNLLAVLKYNFM